MNLLSLPIRRTVADKERAATFPIMWRRENQTFSSVSEVCFDEGAGMG
jgi:hypothetical protein